MAMQDLAQDYEPKRGDVRSVSKLDSTSTFSLSLYTGEAWANLAAVSSDELGLITEGLTLLGRSQGEKAMVYTWRAEMKEQPAPAVWWAMRETRQNKQWRKPCYGLGELVWKRWDPQARPKVITGISLVPAYYDDHRFGEDEDESTPQTWLYLLNEREEEEEEDRLLNQVGLVALLAARAVAVAVIPTGDDFDPFLNSDDLA